MKNRGMNLCETSTTIDIGTPSTSPGEKPVEEVIADVDERLPTQQLFLVKREQAKADAERMITVLNQQMRLEKEREAELDIMFQDEAQKEWTKRAAEWERKRQARRTSAPDSRQAAAARAEEGRVA